MLIDEADVFLERRSSSDIKRNGLVSGILLALFPSSEFADSRNL